jgi:hypothetical protein
MITYTSQKFNVLCEDNAFHEFDGFVAEGVGLGYYINPPVKDVVPEYALTNTGICDVTEDTWYIIKHLKSERCIFGEICLSESLVRAAIEAWACLTDWNQDYEDLAQDEDLEERVQVAFEDCVTKWSKESKKVREKR